MSDEELEAIIDKYDVVDPYGAVKYEELRSMCREIEAASLSYVFVNADHSCESALDDIRLWGSHVVSVEALNKARKEANDE